MTADRSIQPGSYATTEEDGAKVKTGVDLHSNRFVRKLRQDLGAVEGAVREPWSNGPVEGHINRLKILRRQMYGRGSVELRARLLPVPLAGMP